MTAALFVLLALVILTALALMSRLRFEAIFGDQGGRFGVQWTVLSVGFDTSAKELSLSLLSRVLYRRRTGEKRPTPPKEKKPKERPRIPARRWLDERDALVANVRYVLRHVTIERLDIEATLATPDPSITGALYGVAAGAAYPLARVLPNVRLGVAPDFVGERPSGRVSAALNIRIVYLVVTAWRFLILNRRVQKT